MKKLLVLSLVVAFLLFVGVSLAQEQQSTSPGQTIRDNLRERVEERLASLTNKPRAFVGKIISISNSTLVIETPKGETKQVKIDSTTTIIHVTSKGSKTIKETDLTLGNFVVAMGYLEDKDALDSSRILTMEENPLTPRRPIFGIVQEIKGTTVTVTVPQKDETWTIKTSSQTRITGKIDNKVQKITISDINEDDRIIAIGSPTPNAVKTITARLIHIIPGKTKATASPSPSPTPRSTSTPKPTPTPTP